MEKLAIHFHKYKKAQVNMLWKHNFRKNENYANQNIDREKSKDNIIYVEPEKTLYKDAKKHIEENVTGRVNQESTWIIESVVYAPANVSAEEQDRFYRDVLEFLKKKFGERNIIASVAHLDESRSHCHTSIIPVTEDGRLSAKDVLNRKALLEIHTELADFLRDRGHEIKRGERAKKGEKLESLSVNEYKLRAEKQRDQLRSNNVQLAKRVLEREINRMKHVERERVR